MLALGCMRLSTDADRDDDRAVATLRAALDAGITWFDTARAYAWNDDELGHNERLLGRVLAGTAARAITKGGMTRPDGRWVPDGRARALREDCEASLAALAGVPVEVYLLHAPDPRTPWATSVRGLAALVDDGLVARVGLSNVSRRQLDEALDLAPISAVEIALGAFDDEALRGGVVERCLERGITVLAHSPLGGPAKAPRLARDRVLAEIARKHGVGPADIVLAHLVSLGVVPVPGARRPGTAAACAAAARLRLDDEDRRLLGERFGFDAALATPRAAAPRTDAEIVLVMGIQGAGKTDTVAGWVARGYERLNRDERGGTLKDLLRLLDERLRAGARHVVLDNTYLTRAVRRDVLTVAARHGVPVRGVWLDTPVAEAQVNLVDRMLARAGRLLDEDELRKRRDPALIPPLAQLRAIKEAEPPAEDEGFAVLERVPFVRRPRPGRAGRFVALEAAPLARPGDLVFGWRPGGVGGEVDARGATVAICPHPAGPPRCWCRPPLPGLVLAFARAHGIDPAASELVGMSPAHRTLAANVGATFVDASSMMPP